MGSHLILAGVSERVLGQLTQTGATDIVGEQNVFPVEHSVGAAVTAGLERALELVDAAQESPAKVAPDKGRTGQFGSLGQLLLRPVTGRTRHDASPIRPSASTFTPMITSTAITSTAL